MEAKELIDIIYPEHDRTSCSDEDTSNGFCFSLDEWNDVTENISKSCLPRCKRCALLEINSGTIKLTEKNKEIINKYFW